MQPMQSQPSSVLPLVSVIVPFYKVEDYIADCARSLFRQTWSATEFIFVNDGSTDASAAVLENLLNEEFPSLRDRVTVLTQLNRGLPAARMAGLAAASGDYIAHVDSDDWVEADFVESLVRKAIQEDADAVYCDCFKEYVDKPHKIVPEADLESTDGASAVRAIHDGKIRAYMCNKLLRRSLYETEPLLVPRYSYHEDIVFQTQLLFRASKCVHLGRPLYHYRRRRAGSMTASSVVRTHRASAENMLALYEGLPEDGGLVTLCGRDLLLRAGWYCCLTFAFSLLRAHPRALQALRMQALGKNGKVSLAGQVFIKLICRLFV